MSKLDPPSLPQQSTQAVDDTNATRDESPASPIIQSPNGRGSTVAQDIEQAVALDTVNSNISASFDLDTDNEQLHDLLKDLIDDDGSTTYNGVPEGPYTQMNIFPQSPIEDEQEFYSSMIQVSKDASQEDFHKKLKHFMIFSISGKPIYSLHGTEDLILGYTGLITTIVALFELLTTEEVKSIELEDLKIVIMNKNPLILVSITKIKYEMILNQNTNENSLLVNQLKVLYNYLLSILTKPVIAKLFHNRMNYDLRKSLTPLDFYNLDHLAMKLTYGLDETCHDCRIGLDSYLGELLDNSIQTIMVTNTLRSKLNSILQQLRDKEDLDYLFGLMAIEERMINLLKPKTHNLSWEDIKNMMLIIKSNAHNDLEEDLWLPICMPDFNVNGFLFCFVKTFDLSKYLEVDGRFHEPLLVKIILISTNKNKFFDMQKIAASIIDQIVETEAFRNTLYKELVFCLMIPKKSSMTHFVYKIKANNQFVSSPIIEILDRDSLFKLIYYYTNLFNSKTTTIKSLTSASIDKKLTYLKFDGCTGLMISDTKYEFYCISHQTNLSDLIDDSLSIIKWCQRYHKRLFNNIVQYSF